MTDIDLDAIGARAQAATEGPWELRYMLGQETWPLIVADGIGTIANIPDHGMSEEDARFIAHAREDIPALLAEVRRLHGNATTIRSLADGRLPNYKEDDYDAGYVHGVHEAADLFAKEEVS